jgi:hypothetical protein
VTSPAGPRELARERIEQPILQPAESRERIEPVVERRERVVERHERVVERHELRVSKSLLAPPLEPRVGTRSPTESTSPRSLDSRREVESPAPAPASRWPLPPTADEPPASTPTGPRARPQAEVITIEPAARPPARDRPSPSSRDQTASESERASARPEPPRQSPSPDAAPRLGGRLEPTPAPTPTAAPTPAPAKVTIEIGRIEIVTQSHARKPAGPSRTAPRGFSIDADARFRGLGGRS